MEQWHDNTALRDWATGGAWHLPGLLVDGLRSLAAVAMRYWLRFYHGFTIVGQENLPSDRSFVLVANHVSHLDTLCLLSALPIRRLHRAFPAAARDYFCVSALWTLLAKLVINALPFDRQRAHGESLSACERLLAIPGNILLLFPEGTRSSDGEPGEFKPGVAFLVAGRETPVVPCHLAGTHAALAKGEMFPRPRPLRLIVGRPRVYAHLPCTKVSRKQICRDLREAVISLGKTNPNTLSPNREALWTTAN